jgi:hypothetical protein
MNKKRENPVVGQILYSLNVGSAARNCPQMLGPVRVISVGRKYFTVLKDGCSDWCKTKYYLEDWREVSDYTPDTRLYVSEKEYDDDKLHNEMASMIMQAFNRQCNMNTYSLEDLAAICSILKKYEVKSEN